MKRTFEAVNKSHSILPELFEQGYPYYSLDVISLFSNVLLNRTIKIILKRVYEEKNVSNKTEKEYIEEVD